MLDGDHCYEAILARDSRFDGVFYVGVSTTGVYCRPVCPVRTPGRDRCTFYPSAAGAESAGFRPCLRCRPELAPGSASIDATARLARAAAARIDAGALSEGTVEDLAAELGIGARQLRRVVERELGVSPTALAQTRRLLVAKQLLTETGLRVVDIAFASGFSSVRQFNRTFRDRYRMSPTRLRHSAPKQDASDSIVLKLGLRPPLAWGPLVDFLVSRGAPAVEQRHGDRYVRTVELGEHAGWISAAPDASGRNLLVELSSNLTRALHPLLTGLRRLFDTDANPAAIDAALARDSRLAPLVGACPGLRVPGALDGFELALRTVLGQQISVKAATTVYGRFVEAFGTPVATPIEGLVRAAPLATAVAAESARVLADLGLTGGRADTIARLSEAMAGGDLRLEQSADSSATQQALTAIPGIGPWTAQYVAMRALADPDAIPVGDLGLRHATGLGSGREVAAASEAWRPWRAYACMHLWRSLAPKNEESSE